MPCEAMTRRRISCLSDGGDHLKLCVMTVRMPTYRCVTMLCLCCGCWSGQSRLSRSVSSAQRLSRHRRRLPFCIVCRWRAVAGGRYCLAARGPGSDVARQGRTARRPVLTHDTRQPSEITDHTYSRPNPPTAARDRSIRQTFTHICSSICSRNSTR